MDKTLSELKEKYKNLLSNDLYFLMKGDNKNPFDIFTTAHDFDSSLTDAWATDRINEAFNILFGLSERKNDRKNSLWALEIFNSILWKMRNGSLQSTSKSKLVYDISSFTGKTKDKIEILFDINTHSSKIQWNKKLTTFIITIGVSDVLQKNPNATLPIAFHDKKDHFIHEFIHYITLKKSKRGVNTYNGTIDSGYINHPSEFNSFFLQAASYFWDIFNNNDMAAKNIDERKSVFGSSPDVFLEAFWSYMNKTYPQIANNIDDKYKSKWNKRAFQLWFDLVNNEDNFTNKTSV